MKNEQISKELKRILEVRATIEDEVFYRSTVDAVMEIIAKEVVATAYSSALRKEWQDYAAKMIDKQ